jgi:hypothetical protein
MKVWRATSTPDKDFPERATERVTLHVYPDKESGGFIACLIATDGYQAIRRNIETDADAKEVRTSIPREAVEKAEKAMKPGNRAYFDDNKITVVEVNEDELTGIESLRTIATMPYVEQLDMFIDLETSLQKAVNADLPSLVSLMPRYSRSWLSS